MDLSGRRSPPGWLPFAVLATAAVYLAVRWGSIPPRWTVHWDARGNPDGWASRDLGGVFEPLLLGALLIAAVEGLAWLSRRRPGGPSFVAAVRVASAEFVRLVSCGLALAFAVLSVQLPLGPKMPVGLQASLPLLPLLAAIALGGVRMTRALGRARRDGHAARVEGYRALYYSNAKDTRLWVPKITGIGWTVNFAHPRAWPVMLLLVGVPLAIALVLAAGGAR